MQKQKCDLLLSEIANSYFRYETGCKVWGFFFLVFLNLIPGLMAIPRCRLGNQDLHVNSTRIITFWFLAAAGARIAVKLRGFSRVFAM